MTAQDSLNLIWIDLEMTGLVPERERIIHISTEVTAANLNVFAEGHSLVDHQHDHHLDAINASLRNQQGGTGFTQHECIIKNHDAHASRTQPQ